MTAPLAVVAAWLLCPPPAQPDVLSVGPDRDNTLYEHAAGALSNGQGVHLFAGVTGVGLIHRCLLRFDVAGALPAGSTVTGVELRLFMSKTSITAHKSVSLHRALAAWGEGASDAAEEEGMGDFAEPGDATWLHTFFPGQLWTTAGGDFEPAASATLQVGPVGAYAWTSTPALVADAQLWLDHPEQNHGWCVVGAEGPAQSSKRFDSREHPDLSSRPLLVIDFVPPGGCGAVHAALEVVRLGDPPNPAAFLPGQTSAPVLGALWDPLVDHAAFLPGAMLDAVLVSPAPANLPSPLGTILCDLSAASLLFTAAPGTPFAIAIPTTCALAGAMASAQAGSVDAAGSIALANALDVTIGAP